MPVEFANLKHRAQTGGVLYGALPRKIFPRPPTFVRSTQLGAARAVHVLLASAARASRREAFLRWRGAIAAAAATSRLQNSRLVAIQRCASGQRLRELGVAWRTLSSNSRQARLVVTAVARIEGMLFRARQRSVSHRLGVWRSEALAGAIADGEMHTVLGNRHAAVRLLAGTIARVEQRRLASGWRALTLFVAERRRAEAERASMSVRAPVLLQRSVERVTRREVGKRFRRWREVVADRRLQGAVGAARATLEGEKAVLAAELMKLKRHGAVLLLASFVDRCERCVLRRTNFYAARYLCGNGLPISTRLLWLASAYHIVRLSHFIGLVDDHWRSSPPTRHSSR